MIFLSHVGAIGDHNAHGQRHGVEQLSHCRDHCFDGKSAEIRFDVVFQSLYGAGERHSVNGNADNQHQQQGHQNFADLFNSFLYTQHNNAAGDEQKDGEEQERTPAVADKVAEKAAVVCRSLSGTGEKDHEVFEHPSADDAVVWHNDNRDCAGQPSQGAKPLVHSGIGTHDALSGAPANGDFCQHQRIAKGQRQNDIHQQENAAAVFGCQIGEAPDVPQTYGRSCRCQDKADFRPESCFFLCFLCTHSA